METQYWFPPLKEGSRQEVQLIRVGKIGENCIASIASIAGRQPLTERPSGSQNPTGGWTPDRFSKSHNRQTATYRNYAKQMKREGTKMPGIHRQAWLSVYMMSRKGWGSKRSKPTVSVISPGEIGVFWFVCGIWKQEIGWTIVSPLH